MYLSLIAVSSPSLYLRLLGSCLHVCLLFLLQMDFHVSVFRNRINWTLLDFLGRGGFDQTAKEAAAALRLEVTSCL